MTPYYAPEEFGAGVSMTELSTTLASKGHDVQVLTLMPNYPKGEVFPEYEGKQALTETLDGVKVVRRFVKPASRTANLVAKGLAAYKVLPAFKSAYADLEKPDIIFTISPPPFAGLAAQWLAKRWNIPYVVRVADIASRAVAAANASNNPLSKVLAGMEKKMLRMASGVNVVSAGYLADIEKIRTQDTTLVVHDWADGSELRPLAGTESFRNVWDLEGKFILMYSGSIGFTSDLGPVLRAISKMHYRNRLVFLITGNGPKLEEVKAMAKGFDLDNVIFRDLVPRSDLNKSLATAHMHVATLTPEGAKSSTQGKVRTISAVGKGVLAVMPIECDEAKLIASGKFGTVHDNQDIDGIAKTLDDYCEDPDLAIRQGNRAREFFDQHFDLTKCVGMIEEQLATVAKS